MTVAGLMELYRRPKQHKVLDNDRMLLVLNFSYFCLKKCLSAVLPC